MNDAPGDYQRPELSADEEARLRRAYDDLLILAGSDVPAVAAAARAAVAQLAAALSGQNLHYELYSDRWK